MLLSRAELEANNPRGPRHGRFFCPICQPHGGRTPDLSVDERRAIFHCFKCEAKGRVVEEVREAGGKRPFGRSRRPAPNSQSRHESGPTFYDHSPPIEEEIEEIPPDYIQRCRREFAGSIADDYERRRGIDGVRTGMGYDPEYPFPTMDSWVRTAAVVFFFHDLNGHCVARQGRAIASLPEMTTQKVTFGKISRGVFHAEALAAPEVVLCEGPNTAAALVERGYPAIALGGKIVHEWLVEALIDRKVWISFDNDDPGRKAAEDARALFESVGGAVQILLPPHPGRDWNDELLSNPELTLPEVTPFSFPPSLEDVRAQCRRLLRHARGEAREMLEEWEFTLEMGYAPAQEWWRRNGDRLRRLI